MALARMRPPCARAIRAATLVLFAALAAPGCRHEGDSTPAAPAATSSSGGEVIATYKGHTLTSDRLVQEFERLPAPSRSYLASPDRKRQFIDNLVMNDLVFDEGRAAGYDKDPEVERQVEELRKRLVVQRVMRQYQTPPTISDEQVRTYYDQNPTLYSTTQIHASHILLKDEAAARAVLAEVKASPDKFADIAREKSTDPVSAKKGGDLGTFGPGRMVPDFERVAFSLKPGEISDVVKTQYGYHIILVSERKEGDQRPFEQVKEQIRATLRNKALQDQVQGHFDQLRKDADVKVNDEALARVTPPAPTPGQTLPPGPMGH